MNNETPTSVSITIAPADRRCQYWAKVLRADAALPDPSKVAGASDVPGHYARRGDEELFAGDVLIEREARHHRKNYGWATRISYVGQDGKLVRIEPDSNHKAALKAQGLESQLLAGAGDLAAAIRIAHGLRAGLDPLAA